MLDFQTYATRRKLNIDNFVHLTYDEFCTWCANRNISPVTRVAFLESQTSTQPVLSLQEYEDTDDFSMEPLIDIEPVQVSVQINPIDWTTLGKKRKSDIQSMCETRGIEYSDETKRELIEKLKLFEDIV